MASGAASLPDRRLTVLLLGLGWLAGTAQAGDWRVTPRLTLRETYSDNIRLDPPGQEQGDFVTEVLPGISVHGEGGRIKLNFDYQLQHVRYRNGTADSDLRHQMQAIGTAELVQQMVFVDVGASAAQQNTDSRGRIADSNLLVTGNLSDVYTFRISPYVLHHFGALADAELRYTYDDVRTDGSGVGAGNVDLGDSTSNRILARLDSGREFARFPWSLSYNAQKVENSDGTESEYRRAEAVVSYVIDRRWTVFGGVGQETNDFATNQDRQDGNTWRGGVTWTPSERTFLQTGYGKRFFGSDFFLDFRHRSRRTAWAASYTQDVNEPRQSQLDRVLIPLTDPFGQPIPDPRIDPVTGLPLDSFDILGRQNETVVSKTLEGSVAVQGRRTSASARLYHREVDYQVTGDQETVMGTSLSASRQLSPHTSLGLNGSWQQSEFSADGREDTYWNVGLGLTHQLSRDLSAVVDVRRLERESTEVDSDYTENRVSAGLTVSF